MRPPDRRAPLHPAGVHAPRHGRRSACGAGISGPYETDDVAGSGAGRLDYCVLVIIVFSVDTDGQRSA